MIAYIEGKLMDKTPTYAIVDCGGVGFMLNISLFTYSKLPALYQNCKLVTHLSIKEDAHTLYAFIDEKERELFRLLISVSGIGVGTARMILSAINPQELISYISSGKVGVLQTVKGIGTKTAQRIIIELKDKILKANMSVNDSDFMALSNNVVDEALSALVLLGFSKQIAGKAIEKIMQTSSQDVSVEELIKKSLKIL
jgi:holliday junction DNA helicase RuvA